MEKAELQRKNKLIKEVNRILIKRYGIPERQEPLPDPVDLLIATILSQNTNDNNSFKAYNNLKSVFTNWQDLLTAKISRVEKLISVAGLSSQKVNAIMNFIKTTYKEKKKKNLDYLHGYTEEKAIDELTRFPGIGVKTASCVLLFAMDRNVCPVDTHVHRLANRLGIVKTSAPDKSYFLINENFPAGIAHQFHTNLIKLGREICKPNNPACYVCPLEKLCIFDGKNFEKVSNVKRKDFMLLDNVRKAK